MIVCPNCSQSNLEGTAFCHECGAALTAADTLSTQNIDSRAARARGLAQESPIEPASGPQDNWISLHLLDTGQMLPLTGRNEFTMGRISQGQSVMPDIDLSPFQAHARGVSRLHAVIKRGVDQVFLMDLDSANGTFINGKRLVPNEEQPVRNGDVVALGRLKIQILLKAP